MDDKLDRIVDTAEQARVEIAAKKEQVDADVEQVVDAAKQARAEVVDKALKSEKAPLLLKIFAVASLLLGIATIALVCVYLVLFAYLTHIGEHPGFENATTGQAVALNIVALIISAVLSAQFVVFALRVLRNKLKGAAVQADAMVIMAFVHAIFTLMIDGVSWTFAYTVCLTIFLIALTSYLDPTLAEERRLQRRLQALDDRSAAEAGTLGRDETGKGYIKLNYFNIFWIFMVACVLGWAMEMAVCPFLNGRIEDRTGMLWGPLSPIYGFGAVLMTMALNRFYNKNPFIIYVVSAFIGAGFEFLVSWFFQFAFGIVAWDYSGEFMNLDGRTDLFHALAWGALGLVFVRYLLPRLLALINKIPWNWRYSMTALFTALMLFNGTMTMLSFDCWYQRMSGVTPDTPVAQFFAENFDNAYMAQHFPTMSIDPSRSTRS